MFIIVWSFRIRKESRREFETAYGPDGTWVKFFRSGKGYLQTELLHDQNDADHYLTVDRWNSQSDYEHFRTGNKDRYDALDRQFGALTIEERSVGSFVQRERNS